MIELPTPETDAFSISRKEFLKLPKAQRNSILQEQAQALEEHYAAPSDWDGVGTEEDVIKILKERDEAREGLAEEIKFHHRTHSELVQTQCQMQDVIRERDEAREELNEIRAERDLARLSSMESDQTHDRIVGELEKVYKERDKLKQVIIATLEENRHLADGDDCTLAKLKSVVPEWE